MTMQIALWATDGILLASDTKWMIDNGVRYSQTQTKVLLHKSKGVAIALARNMETAFLIGNRILRELTETEWRNPASRIEELTRYALNLAGERTDIECLIVRSRPTMALFHLQTQVTKFQTEPECHRLFKGYAIAGDRSNSAVFFLEKYYERRPVKQILSLAAHTIIAAHDLNNAAIDGLEMLICNDLGVQRVSQESIVSLETQAKEHDRIIQDLLLNNTNRAATLPSNDP
jgi:hypothetical protein